MSQTRIRFSDLPLTDTYTDKDGMIIDDGENTKRISVLVLVQKIVEKTKELVNKHVDKELIAFKDEMNTKLNEDLNAVEGNFNKQINVLESNINERKLVLQIKNNGDKTFKIAHNLSSKDLFITFNDALTGEDLKATVTRNGLNDITVVFDKVPINDFRVVIMALNIWSTKTLPTRLPFGGF